MGSDGVTPLVVAPRIELTLEGLIESPPPEHTWEEPLSEETCYGRTDRQS